jgi:DNA mismatch endonuclease (patch repair protein)
MLHRIGYRYRLHLADLPGKPDLVFPKLRKIIFVHGCFWHMHGCKYGKVAPATNKAFWRAKRLSNVRRDKKNLAALRRANWQVSVVWECSIKKRNQDALRDRLVRFLGDH